MKTHLFLDEDVHSGLGDALRKRGYDVIHAQELERKGLSNLDQLLFAIVPYHQGFCHKKQESFHTIQEQSTL